MNELVSTIDMHAAGIVAVAAVITAAIRALPFVIFKNKTPETIEYLGRVLPYAIMGMLVVYCLKNVSFASASGFAAEAVSLGLVFALHKWKHNNLLSILGGTVCYMLLIQNVFK